MSGDTLKHVHRRVMNMIVRGVVESTNDRHGVQQQDLSLLSGEGKQGVERFQSYGLSSHPRTGSEAVVVFFGGGRDNGLIVVTDDRTYRIRGLLQGEVALYSDEGDTIILKRNNTVEVTTKNLIIKAETSVTIASPAVTITGVDGAAGTLNFTGDMAVTGNITASESINAPSGEVGPDAT